MAYEKQRPIVTVEPNTATCVRIYVGSYKLEGSTEIIASEEEIIIHAKGKKVRVYP